jgi:HK97 family phage major capsid protein
MTTVYNNDAPTDVLQVVDQMNQVFAEFKAQNNQLIAQVERKNAADAVTVDTVNRLNQLLQKQQDRIDSLSISAKRSPLSLNQGGYVGLAEQEHKEAFMSYLRKGDELGLQGFERKALSSTTDADGGFSLPKILADFMIQTIFDTSPIRQIANVVTVGNDAFEVLADATEAAAAWVTEAQARAETATPTFNKIRIPVQELAASPRASQRLLDDSSFDMEAFLAAEVAGKFARLENTAFVSGTGTGQPRGFLTYAAGTAWGQIEQVKTGVAGAWPASNPADILLDLMTKLKSSYLNGAAWVLNRNTLADIRKFKDTTGQYIWQPGLGSASSTLLGYPVYLAEDMPSKAASSLSVGFGNFKQGYTIVDRVGIRLLRDPYTAKPFVVFYFTKRSGGDVVNFEAIKLLQFAV